MAIEIERRFLVRDPGKVIGAGVGTSACIIQGYFGCIDRLRVRVRILSNEQGDCEAFLTFKGGRRGYCRLEYEHPLTLERARRALDTLPSAHIIRKKRHQVQHRDGFNWVVDQFEGQNSGLVIAEIELTYSSQKIELPSWIGEEITFDRRYGNSRLSHSPMPQFAIARMTCT